MTSIIIPAHNEASVIGRCLAVFADAEPGEFEVIVVPNGCTDDTAAVAATFRCADDPVTVVDIPTASKIAGLNAGDHAASSWPRIYLDADVEISLESLRALVAKLATGEVLAVSPTFVLADTDASWLVRSHNRIWRHLPQLQHSLAGRGAYAISEAGHARFTEFPDLTADDEFVNTSFGDTEKSVVAEAYTTVRSARTARALLKRRSRAFSGVQQLARDTDNDKPTSATGFLEVVRDRPLLVKDIPAYVGLTVAAKLTARARNRRGQTEWLRDESTR